MSSVVVPWCLKYLRRYVSHVLNDELDDEDVYDDASIELLLRDFSRSPSLLFASLFFSPFFLRAFVLMVCY